MTPADPGPEAAVPVASLRGRAIRASLWSLLGQGGGHALRFGSNLVLTRLLVPESFGVMAVVNSCLAGLQLFSDFGVRASIIQNPKGDDPDFQDTAWTVQLIRGLMLSLTACLLAWPVAAAYHQPPLRALLSAAGLAALLSGMGAIKLIACERHLAGGRLMLVNLGSAAAGAVVMIVWAWRQPSVWALVAGGLAAPLIRTLLSYWIIPGRGNRFRWEPGAVRDLLHFGRWIFVSTLTLFLASQADRLIFAFMVPMQLLGVYNIGLTISRLPVEVIQGLIASVTLPAYSRVRERGGDLARVFQEARRPLLWAGGAGLSFLVILGPALVNFLYDDRYREAGWIVRLVAAGSLFQILANTNVDALMALGQPKWSAVGNVVKIVAMAAFIPAGFRLFGFPGALAALILAELPRYLAVAARARRCRLPGWGLEALVLTAFAACAAGAWLLDRATPGIRAAGALGCFAVVWGPITIWMLRTRRAAPEAGAVVAGREVAG